MGLQLVGDGVYDRLVDRLASTSSAQFAGKKLVVPGAPETSFLMDKIEGRLGPGEGVPMPFGRSALRAAQVEAIRKWILAGAPRERAVAGGLGGEVDRQPRIAAPAVPPGGYQAHLSPFMLGDAPETEGCQMVRLDNPDDLTAGQWELFMHEGSHHFILRAYRCGDRNGNGIDDCDEPDFDAQFPEGFQPCERFGTGWGFVVGSQTPHFIVDYQTAVTGVAYPLHRRQPLLLNAHYTNPFADTKAEVWVNVTPVDPALARHPARILFEEVANVFMKIPPGTESAAATYLSCALRDDGALRARGRAAADGRVLRAPRAHVPHAQALAPVRDRPLRPRRHAHLARCRRHGRRARRRLAPLREHRRTTTPSTSPSGRPSSSAAARSCATPATTRTASSRRCGSAARRRPA